MDRASVFSGAPFRTASYAALVVWIITALFGYTAYLALKETLRDNLEHQIFEEELLLHEILVGGGADAIQQAIDHLNSPNRTGLHMIALLNENNTVLAGSIVKVPEENGWHEVDPDFQSVGGGRPVYLIKASDFLGYRTVVARSMVSLNQALTTLWEGLLILTLATTVTVLGVGYTLSSQTFRKLKNIESTLDMVSKGDTQIRLPVSEKNDQIDRVSDLMNRHLDRLSSLMISTQTTAVSIAHDLKTPLSHGFLALQRVFSEVEYGGDPRPQLYELERELKRLSATFDTILRISRIEAGGSRKRFSTVNLSALVAEIVETFSPIAEEQNHTITADFNTDTILIRGDEQMLKQLLANLISNSIKYCPSEAWIRISVTATLDYVNLEVSDNGIGVPIPQLERIFDAFYRVEGYRSDASGNGLGLALAKAVALRHGATISAHENNPGLSIRVRFGKTQSEALVDTG